MVLAARSDDKLADAVVGIGVTLRSLRREALVLVVMPGEHNLRSRLIQGSPQRERAGRAAMVCPGAEARVVPHRQRTCFVAGREVGAEPLLLWRSGSDSEIAVQNDD